MALAELYVLVQKLQPGLIGIRKMLAKFKSLTNKNNDNETYRSVQLKRTLSNFANNYSDNPYLPKPRLYNFLTFQVNGQNLYQSFLF